MTDLYSYYYENSLEKYYNDMKNVKEISSYDRYYAPFENQS